MVEATSSVSRRRDATHTPRIPPVRARLRVCTEQDCIQQGAYQTLARLKKEAKGKGIQVIHVPNSPHYNSLRCRCCHVVAKKNHVFSSCVGVKQLVAGCRHYVMYKRDYRSTSHVCIEPATARCSGGVSRAFSHVNLRDDGVHGMYVLLVVRCRRPSG